MRIKEKFLIIGCVLLCIALWIYHIKPFPAKVGPAEKKYMSVIFFDVDQGDSTLIITPQNKKILIDVGPAEDSLIESAEGSGEVMIVERNVIQEVVLDILKKKKISSLDFLFITHYHIDHYGGLFDLGDEIEIRHFFDTGISVPADVYLFLSEKKIKTSKVKAGDIYKIDDFVTCRIYYPFDWISTSEGEPIFSLNDTSIVAKFEYNDFTIMFTGDLELAGELVLCSYYKPKELKSKVLKVGHHGSYTSTSDVLLDNISPEVTVISCGRGNKFGHPHEVTITRLENKGIKIYRTDMDGTIYLETDGLTYEITTTY